MAPSYINTTTPATAKPVMASRSGSASSAVSSTLSSPTSPDAPSRPIAASLARAATIAEAASPGSSHNSGKFLHRIRSSRSRSPPPPPPSSAKQSPAIPSSPAMGSIKRASTDTFRSVDSPTAPPRPRAQKRNSGTTMQVGRHSNDWLFGGFSFTDTVRDLLRNDEGRN